ncbi:MAG: dephospho-CoA kinase [Clostridia bacterium]|nr:dephospho-CoA kinase [Clostridia bacterium]
MLKEKGYYIIDTDILARKAVESRAVIDQLCKCFGGDILRNGVLDRRELARRAFSSPEKTELLNSVTHPEIIRLTVEEIHRAEAENAKAAVVDAPVLFECALAEICDFTVCVTAPEEERISRIMARDSISREDALLRISAQKPEKYYLEKSDIIIKNGKNDDMRLQLEKLDERID